MELLYTEDTHSVVVDGVDAIIDALKERGIDVKTPANVDLLENNLHELITIFLEKHFDRGEYRHHN